MADLEREWAEYLGKLESDLENLAASENFEDGASALYRDANMFILVAQAIGMSAEDGNLKPYAPTAIALGQKVAAAQNQEEATGAVEALKKGLEDSPAAGEALDWAKVAQLGPVMKKGLPSLATEMKRLGRNEKTLLRGKNVEKVIGDSAALAAVAIGCRPNVGETSAPSEGALWEKYCGNLASAAMKINQSAHALREGSGSFDDFSSALKELDASCATTCHQTFGGESK